MSNKVVSKYSCTGGNSDTVVLQNIKAHIAEIMALQGNNVLAKDNIVFINVVFSQFTLPSKNLKTNLPIFSHCN